MTNNLEQPPFRNWEEQDTQSQRAHAGMAGSNNYLWRATDHTQWYVSFCPEPGEGHTPETCLCHYASFPFNTGDRMLKGDHRDQINAAWAKGGEEAVLEYINGQEDLTSNAVKMVKSLRAKGMI